MTKKAERKELIAQVHREAIISAAQTLFFAKGFAHTTIDDIAEQAQYSKRTLYKYMVSKEAIYDEIALRAFQRFYESLALASKLHPSNAALSLWAVAEQALRFAHEHPDYTNVILNIHVRSPDFDLNNPQHYQIGQYDQQITAIFESIIAQGIEQKIFRANINPKFMAVHLITIYIGAATTLIQKKHHLENSLKLSPNDFIQQTMENITYTLMLSPEDFLKQAPPINF